MSAPESFIETMRSRLVYQRRHLGNAKMRLSGGLSEPDPKAALAILDQAAMQLAELERIVADAEARTICECPTCGHTHYSHGGEA